MSKFNFKLVESLDYLNKFLALVFIVLAIVRFFDMVDYSFTSAIFEALAVVAVGILTCGYISLMLNINNNLQKLVKDRSNGNDSQE